MKHHYSEEKALQKLDIPSFSCMTKDKIALFSTVFPKMKPDVAKNALEQFPNFKDLATDLVGQYKDTIDKMFEENAKSEAEFYHACNKILSSLQEELGRDDVDASERERIEIRMIYVATMIDKKDRESKSFKIIMAVVFGLVVAALGSVAITALASDHESSSDAVPKVDWDDLPEVNLDDDPVVNLDDDPVVNLDDDPVVNLDN